MVAALPVRPIEQPYADALALAGRPGAVARWQAQRDAWQQIVEPMLARLVDSASVSPQGDAGQSWAPSQS